VIGTHVKRSEKKFEFSELIKLLGLALILIVLAFWYAYQFVDPAPPRQITIATGPAQGAYHHYGKAYKRILARNGVTLDLKVTEGSIANLELLNNPEEDVTVAFVQGDLYTSEKLLSLGSLYYEPLWVFHRLPEGLRQLSDLRGRKVAVGAQGSGTKALAVQMLAFNGLSESDTRMIPKGGQEAADLLQAGDVDAAILVMSHHVPVIRRLLGSKGISLMSMDRAEAYVANFHHLSKLIMPEGAIDLVGNVPDHDIVLLGVTAQLVIRDTFHPSLVDLFLEAATEVHRAGGVFEKSEEFPAPEYLSFQLSPEAERYYKHGPPFLKRYLPFWLATLLARMKVMVLPLLALLYPLLKSLPPIYRWRMRRKIYRWYRKLADLEPGTPANAANVSMANVLSQLDEIESQVTQLAVPLLFTKDVYHLRLHIDMLRGHFTNRASGTNGGRFDALPDNGDEGRGQSAVHTPGTPSGKHEK
jgi:TRAP transporter TAXI family solute receptor